MPALGNSEMQPKSFHEMMCICTQRVYHGPHHDGRKLANLLKMIAVYPILSIPLHRVLMQGSFPLGPP